MSAATGGAAAPPTPSSKRSQSTNVKVAVRLRPFNSRETKMKCEKIIETDGAKTLIEDNKGRRGTHTFTYDHSYPWDTEQTLVYDELGRPIVDSALSGFNGTIFAYGQTGSGKTWSMMGGDKGEHPGIVPRMVRDLFERIEAKKTEDPKLEFLITVSFLEIYKEQIKDLLNPSDKKLRIRQDSKLGTFVQDLATIVVTDADAVLKLIDEGNRVRQVAETKMNARSSRSHSCFTIKVEQHKEEETKAGGQTQKTTTNVAAKINLVDLAGSERADKTGASGATLREGASINKSLMTLGLVISLLVEGKSKHIPYRDSQLTRLLQESLGGNSITVMLAAISPADDNFDETLSTLQFADRAKKIKNTAKKNQDVNQAVIEELRDEIEELRKQLEEARKGGGGDGAGGGAATPSSGAGAGDGEMSEEEKAKESERVRALQEKIEALSHAKEQDWRKQQELSRKFEEERRKNLANESRVRSVMKTIREDNRALLKRMQELMQQHTKLSKQREKAKAEFKKKRKELRQLMAGWEELHQLDGETTDGPHAEEMAQILDEIQVVRPEHDELFERLQQLDKQIQENEDAQMDERANAAAQRRLIEEDAELRKEIREEEEAKLRAEAQAELERKLEEETKRLKEKADKERAELVAKYAADAGGGGAGGAGGERAQELELELLQTKQQYEVLVLERRSADERFQAELKAERSKSKGQIRELKKQQLDMMQEMCEAFEEERASMQAKSRDLARMLDAAAGDIRMLVQENQRLKKELLEAAAWEPPPQ